MLTFIYYTLSHIYWVCHSYNSAIPTCTFMLSFPLCSMITGSGSALRRKNLIVNLMRSCREMEMKFLVRTLVRLHYLGSVAPNLQSNQTFQRECRSVFLLLLHEYMKWYTLILWRTKKDIVKILDLFSPWFLPKKNQVGHCNYFYIHFHLQIILEGFAIIVAIPLPTTVTSPWR